MDHLHWYEGFSCPQLDFNEAFAHQIIALRAEQLCRLHLETFAGSLDRNSLGLKSYLEAFISDSGGLELWDCSLGMLTIALKNKDRLSPLPAIAAFALHLGLNGRRGCWSLFFDAPVRLKVGDWFLPQASAMEVRAMGWCLEIALKQEAGTFRVTLVRGQDGRWQTSDLAAFPSQVVEVMKLTFITDPACLPNQQKFPRKVVDGETLETMMDLFARAIRLIVEHAPSYFPWIQRVLHFVVPSKSPGPGAISSGNLPDEHGLVQISEATSEHHIAEMLVHEASHQYFHILTMAGPVDDGSDKQLYLSPVVNKNRRIKRILLAYHAFANVALLGRTLTAAGKEAGYWLANEDLTKKDLCKLALPIKDNAALSDYGLGLYTPLAQQLRL